MLHKTDRQQTGLQGKNIERSPGAKFVDKVYTELFLFSKIGGWHCQLFRTSLEKSTVVLLFLDRFRMTCSEARHWISDSASDSDWTKQFPQLDRCVFQTK